jgi:hypothetical protein
MSDEWSSGGVRATFKGSLHLHTIEPRISCTDKADEHTNSILEPTCNYRYLSLVIA